MRPSTSPSGRPSPSPMTRRRPLIRGQHLGHGRIVGADTRNLTRELGVVATTSRPGGTDDTHRLHNARRAAPAGVCPVTCPRERPERGDDHRTGPRLDHHGRPRRARCRDGAPALPSMELAEAAGFFPASFGQAPTPMHRQSARRRSRPAVHDRVSRSRSGGQDRPDPPGPVSVRDGAGHVHGAGPAVLRDGSDAGRLVRRLGRADARAPRSGASARARRQAEETSPSRGPSSRCSLRSERSSSRRSAFGCDRRSQPAPAS